MNPPDTTPSGATAVITHHVREGKEADYEAWLNEIGPLCKASEGQLDWHVIRPIAGITTTYTVVIRFDTCDHLRAWIGSHHRQRLIEQVRPLLSADDDYTIRSGLDFLFTSPSSGAKVPVRWKQFLITWTAIYPLVLSMPLVLLPILHRLGVPDNRYLNTLLVTSSVAYLMIYHVMPRYTKLVRHWLYK